MLEKKSVSGVHLTPKEMQVTNLLLHEADEEPAEEEGVARREEEEEEPPTTERPTKKMPDKSKTRSTSVETAAGVEPSTSAEDDPAVKITFNPGPDIPIIAGMPDAELLDEEQADEPEGPRRRCTDLVPYTGLPDWHRSETPDKVVPGEMVGSFIAPPGMAFSAGKVPTPRKPASLAALEFETISPRHLASLPRGMGASSRDLPAPKMSFPGNSALVGFMEQKRCKSPAAKVSLPPPPAITAGPVVEVGRLFSPVGELGREGGFLSPVPRQNGPSSVIPRTHFDPCTSPLSPANSVGGGGGGVSPFSRALGGGGGLFPRLQMGNSVPSCPPSAAGSSCLEGCESAAATPMEGSVPESTAELGREDSAVQLPPGAGPSPPPKTNSFVWFEDEAGAGEKANQSAVSPTGTAGATAKAKENEEDEWTWVCPDGGWGWLVLAGSMLVNALVPGMVKSFGVLFLEFLRVFHASPLAASWIPALCYFLYSSLGPVACILSNRFSYRTVTFLGGFLAAMGMILSYFAHSITYLYLSYGILVGAGAGLAFPPGVFIVASYFDKRRGLANGLCVSGSALGSILLPPLLRLLLATYGYRGAVLLMGGITFNVWVGAMFYHPVERHMKRVRRKDILAVEGAKGSKAKSGDQEDGDDVAQTALLPRSEAVPIPGQRKVFWYVGKSPGDEEEVQGDIGGDARKKPSTVQQQASIHRRRRRSFSPVDERPLVEVDEEEEVAFHNNIIRADQLKKTEPSQEVEGPVKAPEGELIVRKEWRAGSRQRKTSHGFAESVPEEVEDEEGTENGSKANTKLFQRENSQHQSQSRADSTAMMGSTQSHLHHLSPKQPALPRSLSAASYTSASAAPAPAPMGTFPSALSASSSSFRFVSSIHHGSALAALQTEGSVSVLAASTFTLKSVGLDGGLWERIRSNLLGHTSTSSEQKAKPCNCICRQSSEKPPSPKMGSRQLSGKNLPALERVSNHHSLDRKQRNQPEERKISVASFISAKDMKIPSNNVDVPRRCLNCQQCYTPNCTPVGGSEMNGLALSHDSLQAQEWSSNLEIPRKDDCYPKAVADSKDEKEKNCLLPGQFVRKEDNGNIVDLSDITEKPTGKSKSKKKVKDSKSAKKRPKRQQQNVPNKKLFDLSLLSDSIYLILLLSNSTSAIGYTNFTILLPAWASSLGFSSSDASLLLSVVAATDLIGRVGGAALSDLRFMPRRWYYVGGLAISGAVLALLPFFATGPALWSMYQDGTLSHAPSSQALMSSLPPISGSASDLILPSSLPGLGREMMTTDPSLVEHETEVFSPSPLTLFDGAMNNSSTRLRPSREVHPTSVGNNINSIDEGKNFSQPSNASTSKSATSYKSARDDKQYDDEEAETTHISSSAYLQLAAACAVFGLASGAYVGVTAALFSDMLGPERLASSFGLSLLANGILQLAGPPLCGLALSKIPSDPPSVEPTISPTTSVVDVSAPPGPAAYAPIISTLGLFLVAGAGMWGLMPGIERRRRQKEGGVMI
ncbi:uncharacterized protein LOC124170522 [Ischnura elegans]|uniref:uncharacterized protein LOC124170522 n=1 Tax=Ischnura elegans TaxID=197161 RepID=UPI001ED880A5|nr:uncharacterized protein LOC124170522 [Ischnura elegans]